MVPADAVPQEQRLADKPAERSSISVGQLAHELNSLLDGSLRTLGLALRHLEPIPGDRRSADAVVSRLQTARDAMWQMAELLERAMRGPGAASQVLHRSLTLGAEVPRILDLVRPVAEAHDVAVKAEIGLEAGELPIGPLGAVLLNGLRNAVQACVRGDQEPRQIELVLAIEPQDRLVIRITDTAPGRPDPEAGEDSRPGGHGLGLGVCRQVIDELGGRLELTRRGDAGGTRLRAEVPLRSLFNP
ncbi:MAG: ATP-binding protein [Planctomycetota bacterium]|jgi:C4-dicarboxylate-specific signal transduction histidine kinase